MLREQLAEQAPGLQMNANQPKMQEGAPAGKFWQYQLRQAIRDEVGQLLDSRLNTVDFGLQMQNLMESANFVRETIPADKRFQYTDLVESTRSALLDEGRCIAFGRSHSQWLTLLAEGLERKIEGFQAVLSTADAIVEERIASYEAEDSESVHWTAGVLSHTLPMASSEQKTPVSFMAFDRCRADVMDFAFESVKSSIQTGTIILIREDAEAFGTTEATRTTVQKMMDTMGFQCEHIGIATDDKACVHAIRITHTG
jgi:hypothetical protein